MLLKRCTTNLRNWRNRFAAPFGSLSNRPSRKQRFKRLPLRLEILEDRCVPSTFMVVNTKDSGMGSLRQAILDSNAHANPLTPGNAADEIDFNIPGAGVHTIQPSSALPTITDAVNINGYSQPGASPNTLTVGDNAVLEIQLNGAAAGDPLP